MNNSIKKANRHPAQKLLLLMLAAALFLTFYLIFPKGNAKYVTEKEEDALVKPENFYFTSNYLRPEEENAKYTVYSDSVEINMRNTDGINISEGAIFYTISNNNGEITTPVESQTVNGKTGKVLSSDSSVHSYTLRAEVGTTVYVQAESVTPYEQKLTASFTFEDLDENSYYEVKDSGYVVTLDIITGKNIPANELTIIYKNEGHELIPDSEAGLTSGWYDRSSGTISIEQNAHYTLTFFDSTNSENNYSTTNGQVELTDDEIIINNPH